MRLRLCIIRLGVKRILILQGVPPSIRHVAGNIALETKWWRVQLAKRKIKLNKSLNPSAVGRIVEVKQNACGFVKSRCLRERDGRVERPYPIEALGKPQALVTTVLSGSVPVGEANIRLYQSGLNKRSRSSESLRVSSENLPLTP